jgi:bacterioferritin-associated ferredoxin
LNKCDKKQTKKLAKHPNENYYHSHQFSEVINMFVCLCKGITDSDIQKLVLEHGVGSIRELKQHVALGSECGSCTKVAQMVIDNTIIDETLFKDVG